MSKFEKIYLVVMSAIVVILFTLFIFLRIIPSEAGIAFFGVLVGSIITGVFQFVISDVNIKHQVRLAALDKRLQAHQEAYALWRRLLITNRQTEGFNQLISECKQWWNNNCLYLSANSRVAFRKAYIAAEYLAQPLAIQAGPEAREKDLKDLESAGEVLVRDVYLPSIGEVDSKRDA